MHGASIHHPHNMQSWLSGDTSPVLDAATDFVSVVVSFVVVRRGSRSVFGRAVEHEADADGPA